MNKFHENIINLYSDAGKKWLQTLPNTITEIEHHWTLSDICPVSNMTYNYVAKAYYRNKPVVLKICFEEYLFINEITLLNYFSGHGMVQLIDHYAQYHAMLLHQANPGKSLRDYYPNHVDQVMSTYSAVVKQFKLQDSKSHLDVPHLADWLHALDETHDERIPRVLLNYAMQLRNQLLSSTQEEYVLHGDLHHDNILADGGAWIAIDPKGVMGEIAFEIACFDFIHSSELNRPDIPALFERRTILLAEKTEVDVQRLKDWVFVRLILGACWMAEDRGDPSRFIFLANKIFPQFNSKEDDHEKIY